MEKRYRIVLIAVLLYSVLLANFVFWSGFALGFFITVLAGEILIFTILPKPEKRETIAWSVFFGICTSVLALNFLLYSDYLLLVLDFAVIVVLLLIQLLIHSEALQTDWDSPGFLLELFISPFIRPLRFLTELVKTARTFRKPKAPQASGSVPLKPKSPTARNIFLGLLASIPFLVVIITLLSSADAVFRGYLESVIDFFLKLDIGELVFTFLLTVLIFPFLFSLIFSYASKWKEGTGQKFQYGPEKKMTGIDPFAASAFLLCMNIVYGIFTWVQFSSLFGAFAASLPKDLTYAEYAREGFFQLAFVACINVVLVILGVMFTNRKGVAGVLVRIMSVIMIAFTFVLLASAGYRMKMYISVFALSKMRLLVCIFMGLIGVVLICALIKEFSVKFRFLKFAFISTVAVLILTNFLNPSARIAEYNTDRYNRPAGFDYSHEVDIGYLVFELSFDALPAVISYTEGADETARESIEPDLLRIYDTYLSNYREGNWRKFNLSKENAKRAVEDYFGDSLTSPE